MRKPLQPTKPISRKTVEERGYHSFAPLHDAYSPLNTQQSATSTASPSRWTQQRVSLFGRRVMRVTAALSVALVVAVAVFAYLWLDELQIFDLDQTKLNTIVQQQSADNSLVFDRRGQKVGEFFNTYQIFVPFEKLPQHLIEAIIAIEDRNFWSHAGIDPRGILRAVYVKLKGAPSKQGASTITQQVVRHFILTKERSIERKIQEIAYALRLETLLPKEKILEIYANSLFLGNGSYGVGAAAQRYFGKSVEALLPEESALIAGLFQSPSRYNPTRYPKRAKARQTQVVKAMYHSGFISLSRAKALIKSPLTYHAYKPLNTQFAPYFVDYVKDKASEILQAQGLTIDGRGLRIYTSIDIALQRLAEASFRDSKPLLDEAQKRTAPLRTKAPERRQATLEAALLSVDPRTGEVLAMVGGRDYNKTKFNRTHQALRSPGSLFKPVVFSLALAQNWKWSDVIFVSPITISNYRPHTPNEDYLTETTLLRAFYRSMNTPTVELGQKLGLTPVLDQARRLGIRSPLKEEFGSMLGSSEVNMFDLTRMYGAFANGGTVVEPLAIHKILDRHGTLLYKAPTIKERSSEAISPQVAYLMSQGLRAVLSSGTGHTAAHMAKFAAGKTGTSNDATDNWFAGYAPNLLSVVWVGTDEHTPMYGNVTGSKLALPIWERFMSKAFELRTPEAFRTPPDITQALVHPKYGNRTSSGMRMYFLRGQEPPIEASALEALSRSERGESYRDIFTH